MALAPFRATATEHGSEIGLAANATEHGADRASLRANVLHCAMTGGRAEIHVEFNNNMWWAMPSELATAILELWINGAQEVGYVWDWGDTRQGSYAPNGAYTTINRYTVNLDTMRQRNTDNNRIRKLKIAYVLR